MTASKILKPGRRVDRKPQLRIRPVSDAAAPGLSVAIFCRRLRSSYRIGKRYSKSSIVRRPALAKSAARRGPTPFRYCRAVARLSALSLIVNTCSLNDEGLPARDVYFFDADGQRERIVGRIPVGPGRRPRVIAGDLVEQELRQRQAADLRRLDHELPQSLAGREGRDRAERHAADEEVLRIEQALRRRRLAHRVEVNHGAARHAVRAERDERRPDDADGKILDRVEEEVRVDLVLGDEGAALRLLLADDLDLLLKERGFFLGRRRGCRSNSERKSQKGFRDHAAKIVLPSAIG